MQTVFYVGIINSKTFRVHIVPWQLRELDAQFLCHVINTVSVPTSSTQFLCSRHRQTVYVLTPSIHPMQYCAFGSLTPPPPPTPNFQITHMTMMGTRPLACRKDRCGFPPNPAANTQQDHHRQNVPDTQEMPPRFSGLSQTCRRMRISPFEAILWDRRLRLRLALPAVQQPLSISHPFPCLVPELGKPVLV